MLRALRRALPAAEAESPLKAVANELAAARSISFTTTLLYPATTSRTIERSNAADKRDNGKIISAKPDGESQPASLRGAADVEHLAAVVRELAGRGWSIDAIRQCAERIIHFGADVGAVESTAMTGVIVPCFIWALRQRDWWASLADVELTLTALHVAQVDDIAAYDGIAAAFLRGSNSATCSQAPLKQLLSVLAAGHSAGMPRGALSSVKARSSNTARMPARFRTVDMENAASHLASFSVPANSSPVLSPTAAPAPAALPSAAHADMQALIEQQQPSPWCASRNLARAYIRLCRVAGDKLASSSSGGGVPVALLAAAAEAASSVIQHEFISEAIARAEGTSTSRAFQSVVSDSGSGSGSDSEASQSFPASFPTVTASAALLLSLHRTAASRLQPVNMQVLQFWRTAATPASAGWIAAVHPSADAAGSSKASDESAAISTASGSSTNSTSSSAAVSIHAAVGLNGEANTVTGLLTWAPQLLQSTSTVLQYNLSYDAEDAGGAAAGGGTVLQCYQRLCDALHTHFHGASATAAHMRNHYLASKLQQDNNGGSSGGTGGGGPTVSRVEPLAVAAVTNPYARDTHPKFAAAVAAMHQAPVMLHNLARTARLLPLPSLEASQAAVGGKAGGGTASGAHAAAAASSHPVHQLAQQGAVKMLLACISTAAHRLSSSSPVSYYLDRQVWSTHRLVSGVQAVVTGLHFLHALPGSASPADWIAANAGGPVTAAKMLLLAAVRPSPSGEPEERLRDFASLLHCAEALGLGRSFPVPVLLHPGSSSSGASAAASGGAGDQYARAMRAIMTLTSGKLPRSSSSDSSGGGSGGAGSKSREQGMVQRPLVAVVADRVVSALHEASMAQRDRKSVQAAGQRVVSARKLRMQHAAGGSSTPMTQRQAIALASKVKTKEAMLGAATRASAAPEEEDEEEAPVEEEAHSAGSGSESDVLGLRPLAHKRQHVSAGPPRGVRSFSTMAFLWPPLSPSLLAPHTTRRLSTTASATSSTHPVQLQSSTVVSLLGMVRLLLVEAPHTNQQQREASLAAAAQILAGWRAAVVGTTAPLPANTATATAGASVPAVEAACMAAARLAPSIALADCAVLLAELSASVAQLQSNSTSGGSNSSAAMPPPPTLAADLMFLGHSYVARLLQSRVNATWPSPVGFQLALALLPPVSHLLTASLRAACAPGSADAAAAAALALLADTCALFHGLDGKEAAAYLDSSSGSGSGGRGGAAALAEVAPAMAAVYEQLAEAGTPTSISLAAILKQMASSVHSWTGTPVTLSDKAHGGKGARRTASAAAPSAASAATAAVPTEEETQAIQELQELVSALNTLPAFARTSAGARMLRQLVATAGSHSQSRQLAAVILRTIEGEGAKLGSEGQALLADLQAAAGQK